MACIRRPFDAPSALLPPSDGVAMIVRQVYSDITPRGGVGYRKRAGLVRDFARWGSGG